MSNEMGLLRRRYVKVSTDTTASHQGAEVPDDERWYVAVVAFSNDAANNADLIISIEGHGYDHVIGSANDMAKTEWYFVTPQTWLWPGERLKFDWSGISSGAVCEVHVSGNIRYMKPVQEN